MATQSDVDDDGRYERAVLERYMARRASLTSPAKRLAFARRELAAHYEAKDQWYRSWAHTANWLTPKGAVRYSNRHDWVLRERAWRWLILELTELCGEQVD